MPIVGDRQVRPLRGWKKSEKWKRKKVWVGQLSLYLSTSSINSTNNHTNNELPIGPRRRRFGDTFAPSHHDVQG
jgi:hypothetical protein